jgi:hypothetical protein
MQRYIGIDVHSKSCTVAVMDGTGKHVGQHVVETNGAALVECLKMIPGERHVCLEEGTQSAWLYFSGSWHATERGSVFDRHHVQGRKRFEGEHQSNRWTGATAREFPSVSYAPSEYQTKRWPLEALIESWFPLFWRGQRCFTVLPTVDHPVRFSSTRVPGSRECSHSALRCLSQRSDSRTGVDARCENGSIARRTVMVCLDIFFHRNRFEPSRMAPRRVWRAVSADVSWRCRTRARSFILPPHAGHWSTVNPKDRPRFESPRAYGERANGETCSQGASPAQSGDRSVIRRKS